MFGRVIRSRSRRARAGVLPPTSASADWSEHRRFEDAARAYFLHPEVAIDAVRGVLGRRRVRGFTLERVVDISEQGASLWQEAAVLDDRRLILWHSEDLGSSGEGLGEWAELDGAADGPVGASATVPAQGVGGGDGELLDSSLQVVPLGSISHIGLRTLVGLDGDGRTAQRGAYLVAATGNPHELTAVPAPGGEEGLAGARFRQESFRFSKTVGEDGAGQVARLIEFGRALGRLAPHAGS
ncbi:hypothetical protein BIV57_05955 [Mangrovactinospora gilvigrisea]|uniref:Uncharacterized protein n=1 Tax=Mangrovactinospora gilvigrisea TaxID=1428644 RepID=A0A1J7BY79_9ACTN|nr:hypothetical protein [Mangrovactinospora gilvigrisea]OIV38433.1 hypothetical protein BIV57_05955 [Mangrovactinospora gilvigrisea]